MNFANSLSFFAFGLIMRFLPVFAPTFVAPDAIDIAAAEATTRGLWLVAMGYVTGAIGGYFCLKHAAQKTSQLVLVLRQRAVVAREARELVQARQARQALRAQSASARVAVRVQY